ncbi:MAG TPA: SH3 domain-containing protein [Bryobacteraceae bacterium]|nr:SH3 domain-containing protein [Bryobacteraceae bacterium]
MAYAGPASLNLRKDLASKAPVVGVARHGDKLDVLEIRRRFVKVRTPDGIVGWTDGNLLLSPVQMEDLRRLAESAAKLPSMGAAKVYDTLNMHAEPSRQSPSFFQIPESGSVEVIGHRVAPRTGTAAGATAVIHHAPAPKKKGKDSKRSAGALPMPLPPPPPSDWQAISRPRASDLPGYAPPAERTAAPPMDDWSLVRNQEGKVGWVLSRMLFMSIPDEVAQYAEGHRITAYLPLGDVKDKQNGEIKHNWLWTTASSNEFNYEFDSFRVFVWSVRHHHYETAYIERNVKGFYPVEAKSIPGQDEKSFSLVLQDSNGKLYKRTYGFAGYHVRMISKVLYQPPPPLPEVRDVRNFDPLPSAAPPESAWREKLREWRLKIFGR